MKPFGKDIAPWCARLDGLQPATLDALYAEAGVDDRVARGARDGKDTLPRHQVMKIAECFWLPPRGIVESPQADVIHKWEERDHREMAALPVPLREASSWVEFARHLHVQEALDKALADDVVDLASAVFIDAFWFALAYAVQRMPEKHAIAAARLKDTAQGLAVHGLHFLFGRYMKRVPLDNCFPDLRYALVVRIRREREDLAFAIDRSHEPFFSRLAGRNGMLMMPR